MWRLPGQLRGSCRETHIQGMPGTLLLEYVASSAAAVVAALMRSLCATEGQRQHHHKIIVVATTRMQAENLESPDAAQANTVRGSLCAHLRSLQPNTGSGVSKTQPPREALSGSSAARVYEMCGSSPLTIRASSTLWHQGQAFPTYRWYRPDSTCSQSFPLSTEARQEEL